MALIVGVEIADQNTEMKYAEADLEM